jgi:hypothetical protein
VLRETCTSSRDNRSAPARPAITIAMSAINAVACRVRRPHRAAIVGTCSRKVRRRHATLRHTSRRTLNSSTTSSPPAGTSTNRR